MKLPQLFKVPSIIFLSINELKLFNLLRKNKNIIVTRKKIANRIWFKDSVFVEEGLDRLISRLRKKLIYSDLKIETIRGKGYMLLDNP